jgi:putative transcriptional regulator
MQTATTGQMIRQLRQKLDMTQEEFAHSLGITVSTVNRWENCHSEPSKLARASIVGLAVKRGLAVDPVTLALPEQTDRVAPMSSFQAFAR